MPPFLFAVAVTILIESPCVAAFYPKDRVAMALFCASINFVSNLTMNLLLPRWLGTGATFLVVGESGALCLETVFYYLVSRDKSPWRALAASGLANGLSFGAGLLLPPTL
jgi:peptidoglycan biosynthesis protein MviN/MurJ (putative lipid II flippase)